jgi:ElaB/YqjD/DUF883 family membrane-anchored ribosome-binding protein
VARSWLQATQNAGSALDKALASLTPTVQQAVDRAVSPAVAQALEGAAQTATRALSQATAEPVNRLQRTVTLAEQAAANIEQASREINWQWMSLLVLAGFILGLIVSYVVAAKFILEDLAALRQQVQILQQTLPVIPPADAPRKPKR